MHSNLCMSNPKNDSLQGALGLLILKTLASRGPLHGYGITSHIHDVSNELLRVEEGSLYPALHRMEQDRWIRSEWGITDKNRKARFYSLTHNGRKQLANEEAGWSRLASGVGRVLRYT
jgi:PadR family transcriptional regulator